VLKLAPNLKDIGTLKARLLVDDLGAFQDFTIDAPAKAKLLTFLRDTAFTSLREIRLQNLRVSKDIQSIQKNDAETPIKLPLLDTPVTLSDFSNLSTVVNAALLFWILLLIYQYKHAVLRYIQAQKDEAIVYELLAMVSVRKQFSWLVLVAATMYLALPSLLGTGLLILGHRRNPAASSTMTLFIAMTVLMCGMAFFITLSARKCGMLLELHASRSAVPQTRGAAPK
jgi:membrane-associated HD superfamily phosphohydrolase